MGKGKRNKLTTLSKEAEDRYNHPEKYQSQKSKDASAKKGGFPSWAMKLTVIVLAVILVGSLALSFIYERGIILRSKTAYESANYEVDGMMMQYFFRYQYQNHYQTYAQYVANIWGNVTSQQQLETYMGYFGWSVKTGYALDDEVNNKYSGSSTASKDSEAMALRGGKVYTWWDYYMDAAIKQVKETLIYCEAAKADTTFTLPEEVEGEIEEIVKSIKDAAKAAGYTTNAYLAANYGIGVRMKDIKKALELSFIASEYAEYKEGVIEGAITGTEINGKYEENKYKYQYVDYLSLNLSLVYSEIKDEFINRLGDDITKAQEDFATEWARTAFDVRKAHLEQLVPKFEGADEATFKKLALEAYGYLYYFEVFDYQKDKHDEAKMKEYIQTAVEKALVAEKPIELQKDETKNTYAERIENRLFTELENMLQEDKKIDNISKDLAKWLFKVVDPVTGEICVIVAQNGEETVVHTFPEVEYVVEEDKEDESDDDHDDHDHEEEDKKEEDKKEDGKDEDDKNKDEYLGKTFSVIAARRESIAARKENHTLDLGYILFEKSKEGKEAAEKFLKEFKEAGKLTAEEFEKLAEKYENGNFATVENYIEGSFEYDELDDWAYGSEENRVKTGEVLELMNALSEVAYNCVVFAFEQGDVSWEAEVRAVILEEKYTAWETEVTKNTTVTANNATLGSIK